MANSLSGWEDTIVALSTPPGVGAIGVICLSEPASFNILNQLFSKNLDGQPTHTVHVGLFREQEEIIDEVVVSIFRAPRSNTGEDVIEISCHGSSYIQQKVMEASVKETVN